MLILQTQNHTPKTLHPTPSTLNLGLQEELIKVVVGLLCLAVYTIGLLSPHLTPFTLHSTPYTLHPTPYVDALNNVPVNYTKLNTTKLNYSDSI